MISAPEVLTGLGAAAAIFFCSTGAAVASVPAGIYAVRSKGFWLSSLAPMIIAGVLAIYGLIVAILLASKLGNGSMDAGSGYKNLTAGLSVGLACLASGMGMGRFLEQSLNHASEAATAAGGTTVSSGGGGNNDMREALMGRSVEATAGRGRNDLTAPSLRFLMVLTYLEAIGLYGLIVALVILW